MRLRGTQLCLNDNKNCIGFCSCGQNDPKDFLKTEEIVREPCSGKDNAKIFSGMVSVGPAGCRVLRFQPCPGWMGSTGNFSCVLAGHRNLRGRTFVCPQTTSHLSMFGFLSWRCEDEKKNPRGLGIFDLCRIILHQSCRGRTAQVCLDPFSASFCTKGKKYLFTHTQEPGWAMRPLETRWDFCAVLRPLWAVTQGRHKKPYKDELSHCPGTKPCGWTQEWAGGCS